LIPAGFLILIFFAKKVRKNMNNQTEHWQVSKRATFHTDGMVTAQHHLAASAGAHILQQGGNAIDAAIATGLALGVVEPWMCGLGGSGLMVVWIAAEKRAVTLDFQGALSGSTHSRDYPVDSSLPETLMGFPTVRDRANIEGYKSITVPGAAAGFEHALKRWGTMSLSEVAQPAIEMAHSGVTGDWFTTLQIALASAVLDQDATSHSIYQPGGRPIQPEMRWQIPGLAHTLERYAKGGAEAFYHGDLAADIVADLQSGGSSISGDDLANYQVFETEADSTHHRGAEVHTLGDKSGGTRLRNFLNFVAETMSVPTNPADPETWTTYADGLNAAWRIHNTAIGRETEKGSCTSHLSTADRQGNMVALTHTLLNRFGSGVTLPKTGLLMNNAVSYFDPREGYPTTMGPNRRINASNMCPTIVSRNNVAELAIGASGGNHIMPAVAQVTALMLDFGLSLTDAMNSPRLDASDRGSIQVDPAFSAEIIAHLSAQNSVDMQQRMVFPKLYACPSAVTQCGDGFYGLNDPSQPVGTSSGPKLFRSDSGDVPVAIRA
jgi:gamma-glutamyltranspeptidase / glutathione hydrolase